MVTRVITGAVQGIEGCLLQVEIDVSNGLPCIEMVGMLANEVREGRERVRVALHNIGISIPPMRVTINISPADVHKEGTAFDLPIAIAMLAALGYLPAENLDNILIAGELGLNGEVRPIRGVIPIVMEAGRQGIQQCILPKKNATEGAAPMKSRIIGVDHLKDVLQYLQLQPQEQEKMIPPTLLDSIDKIKQEQCDSALDYADLIGQEGVKRAMKIAAAGFHNVLLIGSPGSGKTMAASRVPSILPPINIDESLEVSKIYSVAGLLNEKESLVTRRPFLSPHHTISVQALAGGGKWAKPGVVSRAHKGVLFLDEIVHFSAASIEVLRQPMEDHCIQVARSNATYTFPAEFMLIASMNPCPCGYYPDFNRCRCTPEQVRRYLGKISGPILDRIDLCVEANRISVDEMNQNRKTESSLEMRQQVCVARNCQEERFAKERIRFNSQMTPAMITKYVPLNLSEQRFMEQIDKKLQLSARAYHRILKVARTIADLEGGNGVTIQHLQEAACYRSLDEKYWGGF